jgi:hypothetical protein
MSGNRYKEQADDYRAIAFRARAGSYHQWAIYCAELLDAQAEMFDLYGRCPDIDLPPRPEPRS